MCSGKLNHFHIKHDDGVNPDERGKYFYKRDKYFYKILS